MDLVSSLASPLSAQWDADPVGTMVNILYYKNDQYEEQLRYVAEHHSEIFLSIIDVIANETYKGLLDATVGTPVEDAVISFYAETLINDIFAMNFLIESPEISRAWVYAPQESEIMQKMIDSIRRHLITMKLHYKYPNPQMNTSEDYYRYILWPLAHCQQ